MLIGGSDHELCGVSGEELAASICQLQALLDKRALGLRNGAFEGRQLVLKATEVAFLSSLLDSVTRRRRRAGMTAVQLRNRKLGLLHRIAERFQSTVC